MGARIVTGQQQKAYEYSWKCSTRSSKVQTPENDRKVQQNQIYLDEFSASSLDWSRAVH